MKRTTTSRRLPGYVIVETEAVAVAPQLPDPLGRVLVAAGPRTPGT